MAFPGLYIVNIRIPNAWLPSFNLRASRGSFSFSGGVRRIMDLAYKYSKPSRHDNRLIRTLFCVYREYSINYLFNSRFVLPRRLIPH